MPLRLTPAIAILFLASCSKAPEKAPAPDTDAAEKETPASPPEPQAAEPQAAKPPPTIKDSAESREAAKILALPDGQPRWDAMTDLAGRWILSDYDSALEFGKKLRREVEASAKAKEEAFGKKVDDLHWKITEAYHTGAAATIAQRDPKYILNIIKWGYWWKDNWIPERDALLLFAKSNFSDAHTYFTDVADPGNQHKEVASQFARRLAAENGHLAAMEFVNKLKNPVAVAAATRDTVREWAREDAQTASAYVTQISDPLLRSHAARGLVEEIYMSNPEESVTWALSISDPEIRRMTLVDLAQNWRKRREYRQIKTLLDNPSVNSSDRAAISQAVQLK